MKIDYRMSDLYHVRKRPRFVIHWLTACIMIPIDVAYDLIEIFYDEMISTQATKSPGYWLINSKTGNGRYCRQAKTVFSLDCKDIIILFDQTTIALMRTSVSSCNQNHKATDPAQHQ